ncbi:hypothetical protein PNOK_0006800 [Pyrrhoderma noxium]|uniref:Uncharacterized protein n=1 Tax=Pyrrhoderma noxium TaxID=2282107 RepID=A0A286UTV1_9AGAM|nr:hypothetical protein PNOK_0006800 [Pyrrhoderma noxium]
MDSPFARHCKRSSHDQSSGGDDENIFLKLWSYDESKIRREGWKTISEDTYVTFKGAALDECIENNKKDSMGPKYQYSSTI